MTRSLKQIRNRIRSIESTQKVTHALEMISAAKLNRTDQLLFSLRPYSAALESLLNNLLNCTTSLESPYLAKRTSPGKIGLCLICSDSGLCGMYNNNIIHAAQDFIKQYGKDKIRLVAVGRKGANFFRKRGVEVLDSYVDLHGRFSDKISDTIADSLTKLYVTGEVDEMHVAYTFYKNTLIHNPTVKKFLNLEAPEIEGEEYILEPDKQRILGALLPRFISINFRLMLLEAFTSEHAARTVAMKTATDNADELLEQLTLQRNKQRQANITQEMLEITSSSEALKG